MQPENTIWPNYQKIEHFTTALFYSWLCCQLYFATSGFWTIVARHKFDLWSFFFYI